MTEIEQPGIDRVGAGRTGRERAGRLEAALARTEADLEAAGRAATDAVRELKRARSAAQTGDIRKLRQSLEAAAAISRKFADEVAATADGYDVDEVQLLTSGAYGRELLAAAAEANLSLFEDDGQLLCYPSLVRVLPADAAVEIDRRRERHIRPSFIVRLLARRQQSAPRFRPEPFLDSLAQAYDAVRALQGKGPGTVIRLIDIYRHLTLLPGKASEYTKSEFARDLYLLDQGGATTVRERRLRWAASSGTRQAGVLTTVARTGQQQRYWGIAFEEAGR